jgi:ribosomal protein S18 acetylase RimI-like enzyme
MRGPNVPPECRSAPQGVLPHSGAVQNSGEGVGREVLALVEAEVRLLHGMSVGLSVFGSNDQARRLYERSGYEVVSVRMRKLV